MMRVAKWIFSWGVVVLVIPVSSAARTIEARVIHVDALGVQLVWEPTQVESAPLPRSLPQIDDRVTVFFSREPTQGHGGETPGEESENVPTFPGGIPGVIEDRAFYGA